MNFILVAIQKWQQFPLQTKYNKKKNTRSD